MTVTQTSQPIFGKINLSNKVQWNFTSKTSCTNLLAAMCNGTLKEKSFYELIDQLIIESSKGKHGPIAINILKEITKSVSNGSMSRELLYNYCSNSCSKKISSMPDFILWGLMSPPLNVEKDWCRNVYNHLQNYHPERLKSIEVNYGLINQGIPVELYTGFFNLDRDIVNLLNGKLIDKHASALYRSIVRAAQGQGGAKAIWTQNVLAEIDRRIKTDNDPYLKRLTALFKEH